MACCNWVAMKVVMMGTALTETAAVAPALWRLSGCVPASGGSYQCVWKLLSVETTSLTPERFAMMGTRQTRMDAVLTAKWSQGGSASSLMPAAPLASQSRPKLRSLRNFLPIWEPSPAVGMHNSTLLNNVMMETQIMGTDVETTASLNSATSANSWAPCPTAGRSECVETSTEITLMKSAMMEIWLAAMDATSAAKSKPIQVSAAMACFSLNPAKHATTEIWWTATGATPFASSILPSTAKMSRFRKQCAPWEWTTQQLIYLWALAWMITDPLLETWFRKK